MFLSNYLLLAVWVGNTLALITTNWPLLTGHGVEEFPGTDGRALLKDPMLILSKRAILNKREATVTVNIGFPLAVGIVIGILGTLVFQGLGWLLYRTYKRKRPIPRRVLPKPSAPLNFRHIEHHAMSIHPSIPSPITSTASLLRIAHRQPDGSWTFSEPGSPAPSDISSTFERASTRRSAATSCATDLSSSASQLEVPLLPLQKPPIYEPSKSFSSTDWSRSAPRHDGSMK